MLHWGMIRKRNRIMDKLDEGCRWILFLAAQ
jgi:hypothetical protein